MDRYARQTDRQSDREKMIRKSWNVKKSENVKTK